MKSRLLNRKSIFMIVVSLLFLLYLIFVLVLIAEYEFIYLFSYILYKDWFIEPIIAIYLIVMGVTLMSFKIKPVIKFIIGFITSMVGIGLVLLLLLGIGFGFANKAYEVEGTHIVIVRIQSMVDYYYDLYEIKLGVLAKPSAELNSIIYPYIIDQIESEFNENELIVKIMNDELTYEIHLYFEVIDDTYRLVDEIQVPIQ